jgi:hypothetical protein
MDMCKTRKNQLTYAEKSSSHLWIKLWTPRYLDEMRSAMRLSATLRSAQVTPVVRKLTTKAALRK